MLTGKIDWIGALPASHRQSLTADGFAKNRTKNNYNNKTGVSICQCLM
jgi:hypothetical protein